MHSNQANSLSNSYDSTFINITKMSICPWISQANNTLLISNSENCPDLIAGIGNEGLFAVATFVMEIIREELQAINNSAQLSGNLNAILNENNYRSLYGILNFLIRPVLSYLNTMIETTFSGSYDNWYSLSWVFASLVIAALSIYCILFIFVGRQAYNSVLFISLIFVI